MPKRKWRSEMELLNTVQPERLTSGLGVVSFLAFGFLVSAHPGHIRWRHVVWGVSLQFIFGLAVLRWEVTVPNTTYRVRHHVSDLGWVDLDLDVPLILPS